MDANDWTKGRVAEVATGEVAEKAAAYVAARRKSEGWTKVHRGALRACRLDPSMPIMRAFLEARVDMTRAILNCLEDIEWTARESLLAVWPWLVLAWRVGDVEIHRRPDSRVVGRWRVVLIPARETH